MNLIKYICFFVPFLVMAQLPVEPTDTSTVHYITVKGDSIPKTHIDLDEIIILPKLKFDDRAERIKYLILRRKTIKVYPYAKLASERLDSLTTHLATLKRKRARKRYTKKVQKYIEGEFSDKLKKMSRTEGQILVKLIHRQTGRTAFDLVKELRNGWRAFWYNTTASVFDISLKRTFNPVDVKEDYQIEDILLRSFQNGILQRQSPAVPIDFYDLAIKWHPKNKK